MCRKFFATVLMLLCLSVCLPGCSPDLDDDGVVGLSDFAVALSEGNLAMAWRVLANYGASATVR